MNTFRFAILAGLFFLSFAAQAEPLAFPGQWQLSQFAAWRQEPDGTTDLTLNIPADTPFKDTFYGAKLPLDLTPYRGKSIVFHAQIEAKDVPEASNGIFCVKLMLRHTYSSGMVRYHSSGRQIWGTFPPRPFDLAYQVPDEPGEYLLSVGLQANTGHVIIRKVELTVEDFFPAPAPLPPQFRCDYSEAVRHWPAYRGAGILGKSLSPKNLQDLAGYGANLIRVWLEFDPLTTDLKGYDQALDQLAAALPECQRLGIKVIPVFSHVPGDRYSKPLLLGTFQDVPSAGKNQYNFRLFDDERWLDLYVKAWEKLAKRFQGAPAILAYDLMNEPTQSGRVKHDYLECQYRAALAIRQLDPETPIIVEGNDWDNPEGFAYLKPLPIHNIIYQVHFYQPHAFTHQGIGADSKKNVLAGKFVSYPGVIEGTAYSREVLKNYLKPVVAFQQKYGAILYCGEFSAIRWAPGAAQFLDDLCSILEEYHWPWTYHIFREWQAWSLEHVSGDFNNTKPAEKPTDRFLVIQKYWGKNQQK